MLTRTNPIPPLPTPSSLNPTQNPGTLSSKFQHCDSLQLILFSGKGGVGKTTFACGFARYWAKQFPDERILLISTDPAHSLGDVLQMSVTDTAIAMADLPNLQVRALEAQALLDTFKARYGETLELLVERGSFVEGDDLSPVWDLSWPGLDELMGILEIQRLLHDHEADRVVVDMAPSGHALNLLGLMDFLDNFLGALDLFQDKHREMSQRFTGNYTHDSADKFLVDMRAELTEGRELLQNPNRTACWVMAIAELMSLKESKRFIDALQDLQITVGGIVVNRVLPAHRLEVDEAIQAVAPEQLGQYLDQQIILQQFLSMSGAKPIFLVPKYPQEPLGAEALDNVIACMDPVVPRTIDQHYRSQMVIQWPEKVLPSFEDFINAGRQLVIVGGKGGVGKTTVSAAIAWAMAEEHGDRNIRIISIDPAHSLGDAVGLDLGHAPQAITSNLSAQEIDADTLLDHFREDYLWELAEMMSGDSGDGTIQIAYGPQAWRQIVAQALPGIDEMLALLTVMELLESGEQDLIVLDTAPTGHLLRFLEMPTALGDWLAWIFKLWIKYQDSVGRVEFMGRLRALRKRVMAAQKKLQNPDYTEFIGVMQAQEAIVAEAKRLTQSLADMKVHQRYVVQNVFEPDKAVEASRFPNQAIVRLPVFPRAIAPLEQIKGAAKLLF
ncbi:MAG: ArsA family ATPase [Merismopedia sp. SIO2A8]|nr:ArsA family ATPase [Merismopedia sp. SIO2A8]